jgi:predicted transposase/invertase (TIGR01784 family)
MQTPHDLFFRHVFADPEHAAGELRTVLPAALVARLDWSSLRALPSTFIDPKLSEQRADLLFSASLAGREVLVYLVMEHQSSVEPFMPLRLLGYLVRIWDAYRREHSEAQRLPPIVPVVVHHSEAGWTAPLAFEALLELEGELLDALRPHLPLFSFVLDDLSQARDDELRARAMSALGRLTLWCLKRVRNGGDLSEELARWSEVMAEIVGAPNGVAALAAVLKYLLEVGQTPRENIEALSHKLGPRAEEAYMTGAQLFREEGRREGEAKGKAEGQAQGKAQAILAVLEARGLTVSEAQRATIANCTDLEQLERWVRQAVTVETTGALFAAPKLHT